MTAPRTPKTGETWIESRCEMHHIGSDVVGIIRDFHDQPEEMKLEILGMIYCGCFFPADELRKK